METRERTQQISMHTTEKIGTYDYMNDNGASVCTRTRTTAPTNESLLCLAYPPIKTKQQPCSSYLHHTGRVDSLARVEERFPAGPAVHMPEHKSQQIIWQGGEPV